LQAHASGVPVIPPKIAIFFNRIPLLSKKEKKKKKKKKSSGIKSFGSEQHKGMKKVS